MPAIAVLALGLLCLLHPLEASADDVDCAPGQYRNESTEGHCCWEGQTWGVTEKRCIGLAECPPGLLPSDDGEDCSAAECMHGLVESGGGCCWPGQRWVTEGGSGRCSGTPRCPPGYVHRTSECLRLPDLPPAETLSFDGVDSADYIPLEPGNYLRGSSRKEKGRFRNERSHQVFLTRRVMLKKTEVTQREWRELVPHNPSRFLECGLDCPVERVNWYEALAWLNRLSEAEGLTPCYSLEKCTGQLGGGCRVPGEPGVQCEGDFICGVVYFNGLNCPGYRLPTEAEWEYAARSGTTAESYVGAVRSSSPNHAPLLDTIAWYAGNSAVDSENGADCSQWRGRPSPAEYCGTHGVGTKEPTPWGHHDLLGNVMEWTWDAFGGYPRRAKVDPIREVGVERVVRGGSWTSGVSQLRVALRGRLNPLGRNAMLGFRAARTLIKEEAPVESPSKVKKSEPKKSQPASAKTKAKRGPPKGVPIKVDQSEDPVEKPEPETRKRSSGVPLRIVDDDDS